MGGIGSCGASLLRPRTAVARRIARPVGFLLNSPNASGAALNASVWDPFSREREDRVRYGRNNRRHTRFTDTTGWIIRAHQLHLYSARRYRHAHQLRAVEIVFLYRAGFVRHASVEQVVQAVHDWSFHLRTDEIGVDQQADINRDPDLLDAGVRGLEPLTAATTAV